LAVRSLGPLLDKDVLVVREFAQPDEVLALREVFDAALAACEADNSSLNARMMPSRTEVPANGIVRTVGGSESQIIGTMRSRIVRITRAGFAAQDILPEFTIFSQMRAGDFHPLHADAERQTTDGWEDNHTPWRTHVSLLYLNSAGIDFRGGELVLPEIGRTIRPSCGLLVSFPSGRKHQHQVKTIESGVRLSFVVWFTRDASRGERSWPA
jgi:predicted 2-oxoglutarate/Fe(II)-dependent dioxygenase YbiX